MAVITGLALAAGALGFLQNRKAQEYQKASVMASNEAAMMNYELALADRAMMAEQRELQKQFQAEASKAEIIRQEFEEFGIRVGQQFRMEDRRLEGAEAQNQARVAEGSARAAMGAANVSGISPSAVIRLTEAAAAKYIGSLQEEERRDRASSNLQVRDSRLASQQRLISINQPLSGIPGVAPPQLSPVPQSSGFLSALSGLSTGLNMYATLQGAFGARPQSALPSGPAPSSGSFGPSSPIQRLSPGGGVAYGRYLTTPAQ